MFFVLYFLLLVSCILVFTCMLYLPIQPFKAATVFNKISQSGVDTTTVSGLGYMLDFATHF